MQSSMAFVALRIWPSSASLFHGSDHDSYERSSRLVRAVSDAAVELLGLWRAPVPAPAPNRAEYGIGGSLDAARAIRHHWLLV